MRLRLAGLVTDSTKAQQWDTHRLSGLSEARHCGNEHQELQERLLGLALNLGDNLLSAVAQFSMGEALPNPAPSSLPDRYHSAIAGCHSLCRGGGALVGVQEPTSSPALTLN